MGHGDTKQTGTDTAAAHRTATNGTTTNGTGTNRRGTNGTAGGRSGAGRADAAGGAAYGDGATAHDATGVRDAGVAYDAGGVRGDVDVAVDGGDGGVPVSVVGQVELLEELFEVLEQRERLNARAVELADRARRCPDVGRIEGMPLDLVLAKSHRLTGAERWMLFTAARVLADMPTTRVWFEAGRLSWSQVRAIVGKARRLPCGDRRVLDGRVAATSERLDAFDPDQLLDAVDRAIDELRGARSVERAEQREQRSNFLRVQPRLFGGVQLYGEYDETSGAVIVNALDAASKAPSAGTGTDGGGVTTRARQRAAGLVELSEAFLAGTTATGKPRKARPTLIVHVPLADVTATAAGRVELNLPGAGLPSVTARTLEALNTDADLRAVLFDGARPLAVSDKICASQIPTKTRIAVAARDRGCRWPGSRAPIGHCDLDHYQTPRRAGGGHHPDGLIALSRRPHRWRETYAWQVTMDHDTGIATFTRRRRTWRSLPWGTPLNRPDNTTGPGADHHDPGGDPAGNGRDRGHPATGDHHPTGHTPGRDPTGNGHPATGNDPARQQASPEHDRGQGRDPPIPF